MTEADERHLRRAIELADAARAAGDLPFGALLVGPAGDVLAEDRNTAVTDRDITAHPELKLARWAARELDVDVARRTTMYASCHPCPMCAGAIARSCLGRVVFALFGEQLKSSSRPGPSSRNPRRSPTRARRSSTRLAFRSTPTTPEAACGRRR